MLGLEELESLGEAVKQASQTTQTPQAVSCFPYWDSSWVLAVVLLLSSVHCFRISLETQDGSFGRRAESKTNLFPKAKFLSQN